MNLHFGAIDVSEALRHLGNCQLQYQALTVGEAKDWLDKATKIRYYRPIQTESPNLTTMLQEFDFGIKMHRLPPPGPGDALIVTTEGPDGQMTFSLFVIIDPQA